jgi:hypothetical protein
LDDARGRAGPTSILWIGRSVWPYAPTLGASSGLLHASIWIDAVRPCDRAWSAELSLRSGACAAVIADASGMDMSLTRRLQLAAASAEERCGAGAAICLLARPAWERWELSAATTRWLVEPVAAAGVHRQRVRLLRCKAWATQHVDGAIGQDAQPVANGRADQTAWIFEDVRAEHEHATGVVRVLPDLPDRLVPAPHAATGLRVAG